MILWEQMVIIALCAVATLACRFLPFELFGRDEEVSPRVGYLGTVLPAALFAMLVVYCFRDVDFLGGTHGVPKVAAVLFTAFVHVRWRNMLLSLVGGAAFYIAVQWVVTSCL